MANVFEDRIDTSDLKEMDFSSQRDGFLWNSPIVRRQLESMARTTAGICKINQKHLESVRIPVPGLEQQQEISEQVGRVSTAATRLQNELGIATLRAERLRRALLAAAFSGRLTGRSSDLEIADELSVTAI